MSKYDLLTKSIVCSLGIFNVARIRHWTDAPKLTTMWAGHQCAGGWCLISCWFIMSRRQWCRITFALFTVESHDRNIWFGPHLTAVISAHHWHQTRICSSYRGRVSGGVFEVMRLRSQWSSGIRPPRHTLKRQFSNQPLTHPHDLKPLWPSFKTSSVMHVWATWGRVHDDRMIINGWISL